METINLRINHIAEHFFAGNNVKFAVAVGSSEANVRNYRKLTVPKIEFIVKTCDLLNISESWILAGKGEMLRSVGPEVVKKENVHPHTAELVEMQRKEIVRLENDLQKCKEEKKIFENNRSNV